jgi:parallel beta-helix repeat protein
MSASSRPIQVAADKPQKASTRVNLKPVCDPTAGSASIRRVIAVALLAIGACSHSSPASPSASGGSAQAVYVATTGNDRNAGTIAAPWLTLQHAVSQLHAGQTLYIRGGTYRGNANLIASDLAAIPGGTSWSNPITIAGYASEVVTLQPPNTLQPIKLVSAAQQYLIFQDLVIDMSNQATDTSQAGVYLNGGANHNRFLRLEIKNNINFGVVFSPNNGNSPFNEIINCKIHNNGLAGGPAINGHGIYIETSDNLINGNEIYSNQGYGVHMYNNSGPLNVARNTVSNNNIHDNGLHGGTSFGIAVAWGDANVIHDNVIKNNRGGIFVYTNSTNTRIYNNTIDNNTPLEGILIQSATGSTVTGNTVYGNGAAIVDMGNGTVLANNSLH